MTHNNGDVTRRCILVTGMHRSGTSAITRVLGLVGATLPRNLMPPADSNPAGFWEPAKLSHLNDRFLAQVGSAWDDVSGISADQFLSDVTAEYATIISQALENEVSPTDRLVVIKDPRVCRLVPLWKQALALGRWQPLVVFLVRNPLEVASSLSVRDGFPVSKGLLLWLRHVLDAEANTRDVPRSAVCMNALMSDWLETVRKIGRELDIHWPRLNPQTMMKVDSFLDSKLRHHAATPKELSRNPYVNAWVGEAFDALQAWIEAGVAPGDRLDVVRRELEQGEKLYLPVLLHAQDAACTAAEMQRQADALKIRIGPLEMRVSELERANATAQSQLDQSNARIGELQSACTAAHETIAQRDSHIHELEAAEAVTQNQIDQQAAHIRELEAAYVAAKAQIGRQEGQITGLQATYEDLLAKLHNRESCLAELERAYAEIQSQASAHMECANKLTRQIAEKTAEIDVLSKRAAQIEYFRKLAEESDTRAKTLQVAIDAKEAERIAAATQAAAADERATNAEAFVARLQARLQTLEQLKERTCQALETELGHMRAQVLQANERVALAEQDLGMSEAALVRLLNSRSWRLTAPLRGTWRAVGGKHAALVLRWLLTLHWRRLRHWRHMRKVIGGSGLFDANFYLRTNPDVAQSGVDPLQHFITDGGLEGRAPSPHFDASYYIAANPDVVEQHINPLYHYLRYGRAEGRLPVPEAADSPAQVHLIAEPGGMSPAGVATRTPCLAIMVHVYYGDLIGEIVETLANAPTAHVFMSSPFPQVVEDFVAAMRAAGRTTDVTAEVVPNRGRDIGPMVSVFGPRLLNYDYVCHLHSKKSLHTGGEQTNWRQYLFRHLLGSPAQVRQLIAHFENTPQLGIAYPATFPSIPYWAHTWLCNKAVGQQLLARLGIDQPMDGYLDFPAGSMFWARTSALHQLLDGRFKLTDFPEEAGQNDGTLAHAIERSFVLLARANGFSYATLDGDNVTVEPGNMARNFAQYRQLARKEHLRDAIAASETVSFDVFDTLITRPLVHPDQAFDRMEQELDAAFARRTNFRALRKQAETIAREKSTRGDVNIEDIYAELAHHTDASFAERAMAVELATEMDLCLPRTEVIDALRFALDNNKRVLFISDMYLRSDHIKDLLRRAGAPTEGEWLVSSEVGRRKDRGDMWDWLLDSGTIHPDSHIHVGDNEHSDCQLSGDRRIRSFHTMSPVGLFQNSVFGADYVAKHPGWREHWHLGPLIAQMFNSPFIGDGHDA